MFIYYLLSIIFYLFINRQRTAPAHLAILIEHAVDAALAHGLGVVDMLRSEAPVLAKNDFYA